MLTTLAFVALLSQSTPVDLAATQSDIQGIYEVIRQTRAQALNPTDIDDLHATLYAPGWTFVDKSGQRHTWPEMRQAEVDALAHKPPEAWYQPIRKMTLSSDGCTATVTIVENKTTFRDTWTKSGESWKMTARQQLD
jgi:hypothetical protein